MSQEDGPERLVCEAELVFPSTAGILAGLKLVGFSLWRSPEGEIYVTLPSRAFGAGNERRFFDYLRSVEGNAAAANDVGSLLAVPPHAATPVRPGEASPGLPPAPPGSCRRPR